MSGAKVVGQDKFWKESSTGVLPLFVCSYMEGSGMKRSGMTVNQFVSKDKQQDGSWHFTICKQYQNCWQCSTTHTRSKVVGLYKLSAGIALQFTECPSITVFSQTSANTSVPFENSSPLSHGQFFFQKNQYGYRNGHKEKRSPPDHEKEVSFYV